MERVRPISRRCQVKGPESELVRHTASKMMELLLYISFSSAGRCHARYRRPLKVLLEQRRGDWEGTGLIPDLGRGLRIALVKPRLVAFQRGYYRLVV